MALSGRVLVIGDNDRAGLTAVRSLGRAGLQVHLVAFEAGSVTRRSRYVYRTYQLGQPLADPEGFADRVVDLVRRHSFDLAVPTSDKALLPLMPRRLELAGHTRLAAPDQTGFEATHFKHITVAIARRLGIAVPQTQVLRGPNDLGRLQPVQFPVVLKPTCSIQLGVPGKNEVCVVRSADELLRRLPPMLARCPVLVQEYCRGHGVGLNVLADRGKVIAAFQHRRVHEPIDGGASSYRVSMSLSSELLSAAGRFCRELAWTGPAMLEFKQDLATGQTVLMEVNGRLWGSLALAVQAGVDFPRLLYELLVQERAQPTFEYRVPFYVRHSTADADWLATTLRYGNASHEHSLPTFIRSIALPLFGEVANILHRREGYDLETWDDPLPAAIAWLELARDKLGKIRRKMQEWWCAKQAARQARDRQGLDRALASARSVLFVCHGNVNRSAFAEKKLRALLGNRQLRIASAGFLPRAGRPSGSVSRVEAQRLGVDLGAHRSTVLTRRLLRQFDLIFYMEPAHLRALREIDRQAAVKCYPLSALDDSKCPLVIPDPDGQGSEVFAAVYGRIGSCVTALADRLDHKAA